MQKLLLNKKYKNAFLLSLAIAINAMWALSYPISKMLLDSISPLTLTLWRLILATIFLLPFIKKSDFPAKITQKDVFLLIGMGSIGCAGGMIFQYFGTVKTLASNVSLIVGLESITVTIAAALVLKEVFRKSHISCLVLAFIGMIIITVDPKTLNLVDSEYFVGNMLMLISVIVFTAYTIISKLLIKRWGATCVTAITFAFALLVVYITTLFYEPNNITSFTSLNKMQLLGVFFISVPATAIGYQVWNYLLRFLTARQVSFSLYLQPLFGPIFSYFLLHEQVGKTYYIGGILIFLAILWEQNINTE